MLKNMSRAIFQQDGAPAHTANMTQNWLRSNLKSFWAKGTWPANSPDLSPIENIWSILKDDLDSIGEIKDIKMLENRLKTAWSNISPEEEDSQIIDRNKLRRSRFSVRKELANEAHETINDISAIYFDGRKDQTRVLVEREVGHLHQDTVNEEHYTVLSEPGNQYVAHITPSSGKAKDIARELTDLCRERNLNLMAVGTDGARVNTGIYNGCIRLLELEFTKPLHWFIYQLHANELPLRHLIQIIDRKTSGPNSFKGVIGKELNCDFTCKPIAAYRPLCGKTQLIDCDILKNLNKDQKYLYNISHAVQNGICSSELASMQPGPIHHGRWTTLANRLLRSYILRYIPHLNYPDLSILLSIIMHQFGLESRVT
ncbi:hypothetical protein LOD99_9496 [Oopsacas minuta]|uniref:Tc1-like transposase DDE domain-containing protein n=1 Tax=Oopsacas minuta TaxID=111878 RepID=A0AAV7JBF3_9METZ|nr:hypothetical protein LOD99_9496 [Oopsacas minuta]